MEEVELGVGSGVLGVRSQVAVLSAVVGVGERPPWIGDV